MPSPSLVLLRTQSDARLAALARDGHERAFEAIVERYRRPLLRACRRVLPEARAEDALQQALMAAWNGLRRGDEVRELRPWLHRIAHNTSLNLLRQSGYDYEELRDSLRIVGAPGDELERRAVVRQTLHGLAGLPPRQREALLAIAVEGRSQDEVAVELGLSPGAVRQLVHRARCTLRAAATAVVPLPLVSWVASAGTRGELAGRVAELSAGAGGAGAAAALAKAGTVAVIASGAVAGPALVEKRASGPQAPAAAIAAPRADREARQPRSAPRPFAVSTPAPGRRAAPRRTVAAAPVREADEGNRGSDDSGHGEGSRSGPSGTDRHGTSGRDGGHEDRSGPSGGGSGSSGGSGGSGSSESAGSSGPSGGHEDTSGPSLPSGSSGPGGESDDARRELAEPSPEPVEAPVGDSSGPGSGSGHESSGG